VCRKNRRAASAPRRTKCEAGASGLANQAGRLAVLGCSCVCDRCGQERTSRKRRGGHPPHPGHTKPPQKAIASAAGFCKSGILRSPLLQSFSLWKARFGGFSFLGHRDSFSCYRRTGQNRNGPDRVCPNICDAASAMQLRSVFLKLYNYDQRTARTCDLSRRSENADQPFGIDSISRRNNSFCMASSA